MKERWEIKKLGEIVIFDKIPNHQDYLPYVGLEHIESNTGKFIGSREPQKVKSQTFSFSDKHVLYGRLRPYLNKVLLPDFEGHCSTEIFPLKVSDKLDRRFLFHWFLLEETAKQIDSTSTGARMPRANMNYVLEFEIPLPPLPEQKRIVAVLDKSFTALAKAKENAEKNLGNAREMFKSVLENVFEKRGKNWEEEKLEEVLKKTETVDPTKTPKKEFIYLDVSSVNKETKEIESTVWLMGKDAPSRARKLVKTNDIIFATVRPTHNRIAIISEKYNNQICSTGYFVMRVKEILNFKLLFYFLLTKSFNDQMEKLQKGASYPAVTDGEVKNQAIQFPISLIEQQAIVQKLDSLSTETKKLEAIYQQKLADLEELKKSLLQKAFNGELV